MSGISREDDLKDLEERKNNNGNRPHCCRDRIKTQAELIAESDDKLTSLKYKLMIMFGNNLMRNV